MRWGNANVDKPRFSPAPLGMSEVVVTGFASAVVVTAGVAYGQFRGDSHTFTLIEHFAVTFVIACIAYFVVWVLMHNRLKVWGHVYVSPIHDKAQADDEYRKHNATRRMEAARVGASA
jgi:uncharacterized membrane protein